MFINQRTPVIAWLGAFAFAGSTLSSSACNNSPLLCNRTYDNITHLGAHDSPFVANDKNNYSIAGNQFFNSTVQLSAGVRLLSGQIHQVASGDWHLCHTYCELYDAGLLSTWLADLKTWLDNNPNDVITILLVNSGATAAVLDAIFKQVSIVDYAYTPPSLSSSPSGGAWPTLQNLIAANTRLMVFIQPLGPASNTVAPYLMNEFTFVWENPYLYLNTSSFSCEPNRPPSLSGASPATAFASGRLVLQNHFLDDELAPGIDVPDVDAASMTNAPLGSVNATSGSLGMAAAQCVSEWGRKPTFILVDWYNLGPAIETVDTLNEVEDPIGRSGPGDGAQVSSSFPTPTPDPIPASNSSSQSSTLLTSLPTPMTTTRLTSTPSASQYTPTSSSSAAVATLRSEILSLVVRGLRMMFAA